MTQIWLYSCYDHVALLSNQRNVCVMHDKCSDYIGEATEWWVNFNIAIVIERVNGLGRRAR